MGSFGLNSINLSLMLIQFCIIVYDSENFWESFGTLVVAEILSFESDFEFVLGDCVSYLPPAPNPAVVIASTASLSVL